MGIVFLPNDFPFKNSSTLSALLFTQTSIGKTSFSVQFQCGEMCGTSLSDHQDWIIVINIFSETTNIYNTKM